MITLNITEGAKAKLLGYLRDSSLNAPLTAIVRIAGYDDAHAQWSIGFYEQHQVPNEWNVQVAGIDINIDPYWQPLLDGKTIDYIDNTFKVV